jgi:hypothetical protein
MHSLALFREPGSPPGVADALVPVVCRGVPALCARPPRHGRHLRGELLVTRGQRRWPTSSMGPKMEMPWGDSFDEP